MGIVISVAFLGAAAIFGLFMWWIDRIARDDLRERGVSLKDD